MMDQPTRDEQEDDFNQVQTWINERSLLGTRPKKTTSSINRILVRHGVAQQSFASDISNAWNQVVSSGYAGRSKAVSLSRGTLNVVVANSMVHQQLQFEKVNLVREMKRLLPEAKITDLRFRVGTVA